MGIWNGQQCRNECAHSVTVSRMHVEVPHMWYYPMPECLHNAMALNKDVDELAWSISAGIVAILHLHNARYRNKTLAELGLEQEYRTP